MRLIFPNKPSAKLFKGKLVGTFRGIVRAVIPTCVYTISISEPKGKYKHGA